MSTIYTTIRLADTSQLVRVTTITQGLQGRPGLPGPPGGTAITVTATAPTGGHRLVLTDASGHLIYADSTVRSHALAVMGMTSGAADTGSPLNIVRSGYLEEPSWAWAPDQPVYLGLAGVPTQTLPPAAVFSLIVGFPVTATKLFVSIREPIILSATP